MMTGGTPILGNLHILNICQLHDQSLSESLWKKTPILVGDSAFWIPGRNDRKDLARGRKETSSQLRVNLLPSMEVPQN